MKRLLITGSSGYLGTCLVRHFRQCAVRVLGIDVNEPTRSAPDEFVTADISSSDLTDCFRQFAPDTVIHAAFLLDPDADPATAHRVNVVGSESVLRATAAIRPERLLVVSSATAYGAWPDNPVPIHEDWPLRPRDGFRYAADKVEVERLVEKFARQHAEIAVSCARPAIIGGPHMDNYLRRLIFEMPFLVRLDGADLLLQFVHEEDVAGAIEAILVRDGRGAYNIAPGDWVSLSAIGRITGRRVLSTPFWCARACRRLARLFRLPTVRTAEDFLYFMRYSWVVSPARLIRDTGYQFRRSTEDTVRAIHVAGQSNATRVGRVSA